MTLKKCAKTQPTYSFEVINYGSKFNTKADQTTAQINILADQVGVHVVQIRRYEAGDAQPTLEVIRKLAVALSVSADVLVFDQDERGAPDDFRMQFEALGRFTADEKKVAKQLLDSLILQHTANQLANRQ